MTGPAIRSDERVGLAVALALHACLFAALLLRPRETPPPSPPRIAVTISDAVGPADTAPRPAARPAPDLAPTRGEEQPAPQPPPLPAPAPPRPLAQPRAAPAATPAALPKPARDASVKPPSRAAAKTPAPAGASRVGADFLKGLPGAAAGDARAPAAAAIGPAVQSSLASAIARQLKPRWLAPQGADAELLVTVLAWELNPDGSLAGPPRVVRQEGITPANRAQARRHAEQAARAVELAAPFALPPQYYAAWRRIASFRFDKRLAQ